MPRNAPRHRWRLCVRAQHQDAATSSPISPSLFGVILQKQNSFRYGYGGDSKPVSQILKTSFPS
jgi:hypothetical protein